MAKKTICIYHGGCLDGFTSAWIVNKALPDVTFIEGHHGTPLSIHELVGHDVIFVDFSVKRPEMEAIAKVAGSLTILDHHKSAEIELQGIDLKFRNTTLVFDMDRSGAMITHDYYFPNEDASWITEIVQDRDLWQFKIEGTKALTAYMFTVDQTFENWDRIESNKHSSLSSGTTLLSKFDKDVADIIDGCTFEGELAGHKVNITNVMWLYASEVGNQTVGDNLFSVSYFRTKTGEYSYSLRAKGNFDCSVLAASFGGGGHPNAAGFTSTNQLFTILM